MTFALNGASYQAEQDSFVTSPSCQPSLYCAVPSFNTSTSSLLAANAADGAATTAVYCVNTTDLPCRHMSFTLHRMPPQTQDTLVDFLDTLTASLHCPMDRFVGISLNANRTVSLAITDSTQSKSSKMCVVCAGNGDFAFECV